MNYVKFAMWIGGLASVLLPVLIFAQVPQRQQGPQGPSINPELRPAKPAEETQKREGFKMPMLEPEALPQQPPQPSQQSLMEETIQKQLEALRSFDPSKAYYAFTTKSFQKEVSLETFKQFVKKFSVLFRNKSFTFEGLTFQGIVATIKGKVVSTDGHTANIQFDLIQEDGAWKIRKINITRTSRETQKKG